MSDATDAELRPDSISYTLKRLLLGRPLVTAALQSERLSNPVALGVLSPDAISSNAYGVEEILIELLPFAGLAAFTLLLPITAVVLLILVLVTASYRQVVMAYTQAGGSYVVSRENFGPRVAQVAAAALLIDYVVTVAVQSAAGTVAVVSAIRPLGPYSLEITVAVVIVMCYANLRGLREAGRSFAIPTYFFVGMLTLMILTGVVREMFGGLAVYDPEHMAGVVAVHRGDGLVMGATILVLLRAFANGGSSLTGVEAISNTVSVFHKPQGRNARRVLTVMACILGFLLSGVTYLAYRTHTPPYVIGYPSVLSEVARAVFGGGWLGQICYVLLQAATALILFTGANTSFNGFPMLASFVAEDRFLPRQLTKRGHRLVFSNGIIALTVLALALLVITGGSVNALVPFYAIGVFTGFAMAGYGMSKHHLRHKESGWRRKLAINFSAGVLSTVVVGIFAVAKFTEGAWLVVLIFPLLVVVLIRLNKEYRAETEILERFRTDHPQMVKYSHHDVMIFVSSLDLAVLDALRYGKSLYADELTAVHLMVDAAQAARLQQRWDYYGVTIPLRVVDCPDRRLTRTAQTLVNTARNAHPNSHVTVLLPRCTYSPLLRRLLHDRTADKIAKAVSLVPGAVATIVPYDVQSRLRQAFPDLYEQRIARDVEKLQRWVARSDQHDVELYEHPSSPPDVVAIDGLIAGHLATIEGRVSEVDDVTNHGKPNRVVVVGDGSGELRAWFRTGRGTDIDPGDVVILTGRTGESGSNTLVMADPNYRIVQLSGHGSDEPETDVP